MAWINQCHPHLGVQIPLSSLIDVMVTLTSKVAASGFENVQDFISFPALTQVGNKLCTKISLYELGAARKAK